jgi:hypothetical protein
MEDLAGESSVDAAKVTIEHIEVSLLESQWIGGAPN